MSVEPTMLFFACNSCGKAYISDAVYAGDSVVCPYCKNKFLIPLESQNINAAEAEWLQPLTKTEQTRIRTGKTKQVQLQIKKPIAFNTGGNTHAVHASARNKPTHRPHQPAQRVTPKDNSVEIVIFLAAAGLIIVGVLAFVMFGGSKSVSEEQNSANEQVHTYFLG